MLFAALTAGSSPVIGRETKERIEREMADMPTRLAALERELSQTAQTPPR
jgi:hypothetical protein